MVSVILPTYNRGHMVGRTIKSIIEQTYKDWELIIVDDASNDDTPNAVSEFKDERVRYVRNDKNRGSNFSRNRGAAMARGNYLAFIDSDNVWLPEKLACQVAVMEKDEKVGLTFCKEKVNDGIGVTYIPDEDISNLKEVLVRKNVIDTSTALMSKKCFEEVGKFDEKIPRLQDWDLFFRFVVVHGFKTVYLNKCLNINYIQPDSLTRNNKKFTDAMTYFLKKYSLWYNSLAVIKKHALLMVHETDCEEEYIYACKKILDLIVQNDRLLQEYIEKKAVSFSRAQSENKSILEEKYKRWYRTLYSWKIKSDKNGVSIIKKYFTHKGYRKVAIYGLGKWGDLIYSELKRDGFNVGFGIDERIKEFHGLEIRRNGDDFNDADVIVVSVFMEYANIKETICKGYKGQVVSILDIVEECDEEAIV